MEKAESKGIKTKGALPSSILKPWQEESVLFYNTNDNNINNKLTTETTGNQNTPHTNTQKNKLPGGKSRQQSDNKAATNQQQSDNKAATKKDRGQQTENKVATQPTTLAATKRQQTDNKSITKHQFSMLVGLQRTLLLFIYNACKIARSKATENLTLEYISASINHPRGSIKTTLQRLEAKQLLKRLGHKNGRGGWSKYSIEDSLFQEILRHESDNKLTTNQQQTDNKPISQPATQPTTAPLSSSGTNNINITTTSLTESPSFLNEEWLQIDIGSLSNIGFTKTHLLQIASQNRLQTPVVQDSIYAFAFDLQENNKAKSIRGDPINFFMGILRNGKPYASPSNYESPQDRALRFYLERKREIETRRVEAEKEAINFAFNEWFTQLADNQKRELLPEALRYNARLEKNKMLEGSARNYFETEVWPSNKKEIMEKTNPIEQEDVEGGGNKEER